ncbi:hypothetical protein DSECCO2_663620 [anaerobic digester metagenome]
MGKLVREVHALVDRGRDGLGQDEPQSQGDDHARDHAADGHGDLIGRFALCIYNQAATVGAGMFHEFADQRIQLVLGALGVHEELLAHCAKVLLGFLGDAAHGAELSKDVLRDGHQRRVFGLRFLGPTCCGQFLELLDCLVKGLVDRED